MTHKRDSYNNKDYCICFAYYNSMFNFKT